MECPLPVNQNTEVRALSRLLTFINVVGAVYLWRSPDVYLGSQYEWVLIVVLLVSGAMQWIGSYGSRRKLRQVGLIVSALGILALSGVLLQTWIVYAVAGVTVSLSCCAVLLKDVLGKPRAKCSPR